MLRNKLIFESVMHGTGIYFKRWIRRSWFGGKEEVTFLTSCRTETCEQLISSHCSFVCFDLFWLWLCNNLIGIPLLDFPSTVHLAQENKYGSNKSGLTIPAGKGQKIMSVMMTIVEAVGWFGLWEGPPAFVFKWVT